MKQITIQDFSLVKEGSTNGKDWALYQVIDSEGKKYSTFGSVLSVAGVKKGESYLVNTETRKNGKWTNVSIKEIYKAGTAEKPQGTQNSSNNSISTVKFDELMSALGNIEAELMDLKRAVEELSKRIS